jgi:apolipoprotein N-acyltransferase
MLLAAGAGAAAGLSFEPHHWVVLLPLSVAAVTLACRGVRAHPGFWLGALFGTVFMVVLLPWLQVVGWYAWLPLSVAEGLFYGLAGLGIALTGRLRGWPVYAAAFFVLVETLRSLGPFGGFPWGRFAFATEDTPVARLIAYVGPAGTTFAVALVGTALAWAVLRGRDTPVRAVAGLAVSVLLAGLAWAFPVAPVLGRTVQVAAVQGNTPGVGLDPFAERRAVLDNHVRETLRLARQVRAGELAAPDLVVWPENSSDIDPYADPGARAEISAAVRAVGVPLLMGAVVGDRDHGEGWHNRAIVWSVSGRMGAYYDKIHPVPFGEYIPLRSLLAPRIPELRLIPADMVPGQRPGVLQVGPARAGVLMCFEVAYDGLVRAVVDHGAQVVVVPTNNATYTGTGQIAQQFAISRLRAVETGRYVVIASTNGISAVVGPDGRVLARAPVQRPAILVVPVRLSGFLTPAVRYGAWVQWLLSGLAIAAAVVAVVFRNRSRTPPERPHSSSRDLEVSAPRETSVV